MSAKWSQTGFFPSKSLKITVKKDRQCTCKRNIEARSRKYNYRGKVIPIKQTERGFL